jgi:protein-tyrosine-phosphatase
MKLVFVCTANIFRSVIAEGLCRKFLEDQELDRDIKVDSAGIGDTCGKRRPALILREFLAELGIEAANILISPQTVRLSDFYVQTLEGGRRKVFCRANRLNA